jgi:hypothetical protein
MDGLYFSASAVTAASASDGLSSKPVPIGARSESDAEAAERYLSAFWWGAGNEATIVVKAM